VRVAIPHAISADRLARVNERRAGNLCGRAFVRHAGTGPARLPGVRKQYHFWPGPSGLDAWDVDRLIALSRDFPTVDVDVATLGEIDTVYWFDETETPTVRRVVEHLRLIEEVDLTYPIILGPAGQVMDGMHRIARALSEGRTSIRAVRFEDLPEPDYRDCEPSNLPYL
jgi:hypothetical protein